MARSLAAIIPCRNEGLNIATVVAKIHESLPDAAIYVYDNASSDNTAYEAARAGAIVRTCQKPGKSNVARKMLNDIDADCYFMVDGDDTYSLDGLAEHVRLVTESGIDMVTGRRSEVTRRFHSVGNRFFTWLFNTCFLTKFSDVFSGYRIMSRKFAKSVQISSHGFELETELCLACALLGASYHDVQVQYHDRVNDKSKLHTIRDGSRILCFIIKSLFSIRPGLLLYIAAMAAVACYPIVGLALLLAGNITNYYAHDRIINAHEVYKNQEPSQLEDG